MSETTERNERRRLLGTVSSDKMDKTITVSVLRQSQHPKYGKFIRKTTKYHVHDENNDAKVGDTVEIAETRRRSAHKCWRLVRVVQRAEVV